MQVAEVLEVPLRQCDVAVVVDCTWKKLSGRHPAWKLYDSLPFRRLRALLARYPGIDWYILSARHGLVSLERLLAAYQQRLPDRRMACEAAAREVSVVEGNTTDIQPILDRYRLVYSLSGKQYLWFSGFHKATVPEGHKAVLIGGREAGRIARQLTSAGPGRARKLTSNSDAVIEANVVREKGTRFRVGTYKVELLRRELSELFGEGTG